MERKDKDRDKEGVLIDERGKRVLEPNKMTAKKRGPPAFIPSTLMTLEELLQVFMKQTVRRIIYHTRGPILSKSKPCLFSAYSVVVFLVPDWGDKAGYGVGLSYRTDAMAYVASRAVTTTLSQAIVGLNPSHELRIRLLNKKRRDKAYSCYIEKQMNFVVNPV